MIVFWLWNEATKPFIKSFNRVVAYILSGMILLLGGVKILWCIYLHTLNSKECPGQTSEIFSTHFVKQKKFFYTSKSAFPLVTHS